MSIQSAVLAIRESSRTKLLNRDHLAQIIASAGLFNDNRLIFGDRWNQYITPTFNAPAIWQHPMEFADFLIWMHDNKISRMAEIGCFHGYTTILAANFLKKLQKFQKFRNLTASARELSNSTCIGVDTQNWIGDKFNDMLLLLPWNGIIYDGGFYLTKAVVDEWMSKFIQNTNLDLIFIDADHQYESVRRDFEKLTPHCKWIALHDINDQQIGAMPCGGVPRFWKEIKEKYDSGRTVEFIRDDGVKYFGIGVVDVRGEQWYTKPTT